MTEKKKILFTFALSALLASCGGGRSSTSPVGSLPATNGTSAAGSTSTPSGNSGNPPATNPPPTNPPPVTPPTPPAVTPPPPVTVADQQLQGTLDVVANQVVYIRTNRVIYLPVTLTEFESDTGLVDMAAGSPLPPPLNIDTVSAHCNPDIDGTCGVQPPAAAPVAPIAAFGIRLGKFVQPSTPGQAVGNQTVVGRIAIDLTERNDSPGIGGNEVGEIMRFIIDKVEMVVDQNGELVSVNVQDGAQIHVEGRDAAGLAVKDDIPAPVGTVRLLPVSAVPDSHGDTSSVFLLLDLETGFSQADSKLAALQNLAGHFSMHVTLSSIQDIVRPAENATASTPALAKQDLIGQEITVSGQPPVSGAGINGNAWIRMYPPQ